MKNVATAGFLLIFGFCISQTAFSASEKVPISDIKYVVPGRNKLERLQLIGKILPELMGKSRSSVESLLGSTDFSPSVNGKEASISAYLVEFDSNSGLETDLFITFLNDRVSRIIIEKGKWSGIK